MSEKLVVQHCAPTLAGLKTGNLFCCSYQSDRLLRKEIRRFNRILAPKGVRVVILRQQSGKALIYFFRPDRLKADLSHHTAQQILKTAGYPSGSAERCIVRLAARLQSCADFPHEIGLFLGYPPEDVTGFIENKAQDFKFCGCWKVYGDETKAKRLFERYRKCTDVYTACLSQGRSVEQLTVAV